MSLEPAGVSLVAENFNKYIKQLDQIQKKQQSAFEIDSSQADKEFNAIIKDIDKYTKSLKTAENENKSFGDSFKGVIGGIRETAGSLKSLDFKGAAGGLSNIKGNAAGAIGSLGGIGPAALGAAAGVVAIGTAAAGAAVAGVGILGAKVIGLANDTDTATKQIAASLGISPVEAANKYGEALDRIYARNPDAEFNDIADAITRADRALSQIGPEGVQGVADVALDINKTFGADTAETIGAIEQLIERYKIGWQEASDLVTAGLQKIPADDLLASVNEYGALFQEAGFAPEEFFSLVNSGVAGTILGTDRAADAVKEFQLAFLEGNDDVKDSFAKLGLNYDAYRQAVDSGQIDIADAFTDVIKGANNVDLSITSNRAALAAFGSQFEDLGTQAVAGLDTTGKGFTDVAGAADKLDERFNTIGGAATQIGREFLIAFKPIGDTILQLVNNTIPLVKDAFDAIAPGIKSFAQGASTAIQGFVQGAGTLFQSITDKVRPIVQAFQERLVPVIERGRIAFAQVGEAIGRITAPLGVLVNNTGASSVAFGIFEKALKVVEVVINQVVTNIEAIGRILQFVEPYFTKAAVTATQAFAFIKAGGAALGSILSDAFNAAIESLGALGRAFTKFVTLDFKGAASEIGSIEIFDFSASLDKAGIAAEKAFKSVAMPAQEAAVEVAKVEDSVKKLDDTSKSTNLDQPFDDQTAAIYPAIQGLEAYKNAVKQAQDLQRSFAREAEDNARQLARQSEDIARKQSKAVSDLEGKQTADRDKLLQDQAKQLDDFEKDRKSQIAKAEADIAKAKKDAAEQQKRDQEKLNRELQRAQDQFNLSRMQSERRFKLDESRLIAEGDVLGLKELRENFSLQQQEEQENFDQSKKEAVDSAKEQQKNQDEDLQTRLNELKTSLEDQRAELLASFDQQVKDQMAAQERERAEQQRAFEEEAAERAIQLARAEEDRRISQARQLEDLGRSLAEQQGVTAEGSQAIATELEKVFGIEGLASNIMTGFTSNTENEFTDMFANLEKIVSGTGAEIDKMIANIDTDELQKTIKDIDVGKVKAQATGSSTGGGFGSRIGGIPEFDDGGIVPGPIGSPQVIRAHGGETLLPTHKTGATRSMVMSAPVVPSQSLNVAMSGGFDIRGGDTAGKAAVQAAMNEMTENIRIAIQRLARRN